MAGESVPSSRLSRAQHPGADRARARAPDHREHEAHPRARSRARHARRGLRAPAARRARLRAADRRQADRRDRRRQPVRHRREARSHQRQRPDPRLLRHTQRHRLDRGGNRQLNCALHRLAVNKANWDPDTAAYLARKQAEGKSRKEALRYLKRYLARRVWPLLRAPAPCQDPRSNNNTNNNSIPVPIIATAPNFMPCTRIVTPKLDSRKQRQAIDIGATSVDQPEAGKSEASQLARPQTGCAREALAPSPSGRSLRPRPVRCPRKRIGDGAATPSVALAWPQLSESGSLERRGTGLRDCPCFRRCGSLGGGAREGADSPSFGGMVDAAGLSIKAATR